MAWCRTAIAEGALPPGSDLLLREILFAGQLPRSAVPTLLDVKGRQARNVSSALIRIGALKSDSPRMPLELHFSARLAPAWIPGLFPEERSQV